jgi:hypothetical protein
MKALRWIWVGVGLLTLPGCGGGQLVPADISALLRSDTGRTVLKAVEAHGGIWRWRQRPYAQFDHMLLETARKVDTVIANRGRDTTITPRLDTVVNVRENCIFELQTGKRFARSASASPSIQSGFNGDSSWSVTDGRPDSTLVRNRAAAQLAETWFLFGLPFSLVDTTLKFTLVGDLPQVDTTIAKGKAPGSFDTTVTNFTVTRLKVEWVRGGAPVGWMVFYIDGRDGRVRRTLTPVTRPNGLQGYRLTVWSELFDAIGLKVGGRRLGYPATAEGQVTGAHEVDERIYNVEFPRQLENAPFNWPAARSEAAPTESGPALQRNS